MIVSFSAKRPGDICSTVSYAAYLMGPWGSPGLMLIVAGIVLWQLRAPLVGLPVKLHF